MLYLGAVSSRFVTFKKTLKCWLSAAHRNETILYLCMCLSQLGRTTFHRNTRIISWESRSSATTQDNIFPQELPPLLKACWQQLWRSAAAPEVCFTQEQMRHLQIQQSRSNDTAHPSPPLKHNSCTANGAVTTWETNPQWAVQKIHYKFMETPAQFIQFPERGQGVWGSQGSRGGTCWCAPSM